MVDILTLTVKDLIDQGFIKAPAKVFLRHLRKDTHLRKDIEATLNKDGSFTYAGSTYASPSVAAGRAITAELGVTTPGRTYQSVNGWRFWQVRGPSGKVQSLAEIRQQLLDSRPK
jgi:hypothetical protein